MKKKARTTYRNCLRFLFRRGTCVWINACQVAIMISFLLFIAGALMIFFMARFQNQKLQSEDIQYEKLKNEISFAHCDYISADGEATTAAAKEKEFNTQFCGDRSRDLAFAWRYFKTNSTNQTCFDLHEQVDCHPYLIQNRLPNFKRPEKFLMCHGLLNVGFQGTKNVDKVVWGPQIDNETLMTEYKDKILHASELIVKCPKCEARSKFYYQKQETQCYEKIETITPGWPAIAESCDNIIELPANFPIANCTTAGES